MSKVTARLRAVVNWQLLRMPEAFLLLVLASLVPLAYLLAVHVLGLWRVFWANPAEFFQSIRRDPWPTIAWVVCVLGVVAVAALLLRNWCHLWAVARKMIIESLHRKVVVVLLVFFVVLMPSLPFILRTEGNPKSQLQIVIGYSLVLAEVLLGVLVVLICTASVCSEIERKHVHVTDTKPLARWQFLVGKVLGAVVLCAALLFLMGGSVYGLVRWMSRERDFSHLRPWDERRQQEQLRKAYDEVLVARRSVRPPLPDVSKQVEKYVQELSAGSPLAEGFTMAGVTRESVADMLLRRRMTAPANSMIGWTIRGLTPGAASSIYIRFKPRRTKFEGGSARVQGVWWFYKKPLAEGTGEQQAGEEVQVSPFRPYEGRWQHGAYQEIRVNADVMDATGTIYLAYYNREPNTGIQFDPWEGVEVLQRAEGFFPNYYRSLLIILCHIVLLASLAILAGSALSFPVASFLVAAVLIVGLVGPWIEGINLGYIREGAAGQDIGGLQVVHVWTRELFAFAVHGLLLVFPQFTRFSPLGDLVNGRLVSWSRLGEAAAVMCFLKGTIALLVGIYIYGRRELARVIA